MKFLSKAYDVYKDVDEAKDDKEDKIVEAFDKIPLNRVVGSDPVTIAFQLKFFQENSFL